MQQGNTPCPRCAELERQLALIQEENRKMRLEIERLKKVLENISFSAGAAVVDNYQKCHGKYNNIGDVILQCNNPTAGCLCNTST